MKNNKISWRHGDWSLVPFDGQMTGEKIIHNKDEFTFGEGEATNHFHIAKLPKGDMQWYKQADGSWLVDFKSEARLTHPEHSMKVDMIVPAGKYKVYQRREKDWFSGAVRKVVD